MQRITNYCAKCGILEMFFSRKFHMKLAGGIDRNYYLLSHCRSSNKSEDHETIVRDKKIDILKGASGCEASRNEARKKSETESNLFSDLCDNTA